MAGKKIKNATLSKKAESYFELVKETLQSDAGDASDEEVVNYIFETLSNLEVIIDDPADFIDGFVNGSIKIVKIQPKQPNDGSRQAGENSGS